MPASRSCCWVTVVPSRPICSWVWAGRLSKAVRYATPAQLANGLVEAADERVLSCVVARYGRLDLLLLDELGYVQIDPGGTELLFQIITEREERASIALASNSPSSEWDRYSPTRGWWPRLSTSSPSTRTFLKPAPLLPAPHIQDGLTAQTGGLSTT